MPDEKTVGRRPEVIVEVRQDFCRLRYGTAPCTAALGTTGSRKCFNTRATCQDPVNYDSSPSVVDVLNTTAKDASGNANDGAITNALHVEGFYGQALDFNGVDTTVNCGTSVPSSSAVVTVEAVVSLRSVGASNPRIVSLGNLSLTGEWSLGVTNADRKAFFRIESGSGDIGPINVGPALDLDAGRKYTLMGRYDGTNAELFLDGVLIGSVSSPGITLSTTAVVHIGSQGGAVSFWNGLIDDVRVWGKVVTNNEHRAHIVSPLSGAEASLDGYWPFDTNPPGVAQRKLYFRKPNIEPPPSAIYAFPTLADVSSTPTKLNPGGGGEARSVLGTRANIDVTFKDAPSTDRLTDKYRDERISGAAVGDNDSDAIEGLLDGYGMINGDFEDGDVFFFKEATWTIEDDAANARNGRWVARSAGDAGIGRAFRSQIFFPAAEGETHVGGAWFRLAGGSTGGLRMRINWYNSSRVSVGTSNAAGGFITPTVWTHQRVVGTAPVNTAFGRVEVVRTISTGSAYVDDMTYGAYDPMKRGTFWAKFLERTPYYQNRQLRVYEGYVGQSLSDMRKRDYFIDKIEGPDGSGRVSLRAKDVLKLADDKRAQAPVQSPGVVEFSFLSSETGSFTVIGAVLADYDSPGGLVRIGDEVIEYTSLTENAGQLTFSTLTRGARNTVADDHEQDDYVQRCIEYSARPCWEVVEDLLLNYANVPAQYVPSADWALEGSSWLSAFNVSTVLSEPVGVTTLITEIEEQCQFFIWWDEFDQEIKLRALRPATATEFIGELNDTEHILENTLMLRKDTERRISQVWVYYDRFSPIERLDEIGNYSQVQVSADLEAEGDQQYGEKRIRKIFSRWLTTSGQALQISSRLLSRFRNNPRTITLKLDAKDRVIKTGDVVDVVTRVVQDATGKPKTFRYQVVSFKDDPPGEAVRYELLEYFTGRFGFIGPNTLPDYGSATEGQKNSYAWIAPDANGFSDGTEAYRII